MHVQPNSMPMSRPVNVCSVTDKCHREPNRTGRERTPSELPRNRGSNHDDELEIALVANILRNRLHKRTALYMSCFTNAMRYMRILM